jgi:hypothetical protein
VALICLFFNIFEAEEEGGKEKILQDFQILQLFLNQALEFIVLIIHKKLTVSFFLSRFSS